MIHFPNMEGLKYFMYLCTFNHDNPYLYLPEEIREIIWNNSEKNMYINCYVNDIEVRLNIIVI